MKFNMIQRSVLGYLSQGERSTPIEIFSDLCGDNFFFENTEAQSEAFLTRYLKANRRKFCLAGIERFCEYVDIEAPKKELSIGDRIVLRDLLEGEVPVGTILKGASMTVVVIPGRRAVDCNDGSIYLWADLQNPRCVLALGHNYQNTSG